MLDKRSRLEAGTLDELRAHAVSIGLPVTGDEGKDVLIDNILLVELQIPPVAREANDSDERGKATAAKKTSPEKLRKHIASMASSVSPDFVVSFPDDISWQLEISSADGAVFRDSGNMELPLKVILAKIHELAAASGRLPS